MGGTLVSVHFSSCLPVFLFRSRAGDADMEVELEVTLERGAGAGEAVNDPAHELWLPALEQAREVFMSVALVEEDGFLDEARDLELGLEAGALAVARGEVTVRSRAKITSRFCSA
jgi:hypothetical protein